MIGQFSGPYSPARTAKIKSFFGAKLTCDLYHQIFSNYIANKSLKLPYSKLRTKVCYYDLKTIPN